MKFTTTDGGEYYDNVNERYFHGCRARQPKAVMKLKLNKTKIETISGSVEELSIEDENGREIWSSQDVTEQALMFEIVQRFNAYAALSGALQACESAMTEIECGHQKPIVFGQILDQARSALKGIEQ